MKIKLKKVNSILSKSKLPGCDYVINPYIGCAFGCSYCYADFMRRFTGHTRDKWGSFVDVKVNAGEIFEKELDKLTNRFKRRGLNQQGGKKLKVQSWGSEPTVPTVSVLIGSVTDPYQGVEAKCQITRKCLEVIANSKFPANFSILTKSPLVTRDIDIIKKIKNVSVGLTITSTDDSVSRLLEGNAPPASLRLKALRKLNEAGIVTYVCINPLLPHFVDKEKKLRDLFESIRKTGNREIWLEHINLGGNRWKRIKGVLKKEAPAVIQYFEKAKTEKYKADLNRLLFSILKDYDLKIAGGGIIDHKRHVIIIDNAREVKKVKSGWKVEVVG